ncbi:MAG TPA: tryptophan synthase subunit alpha [Planctomycetaceae bacterium]|nr:tryptophan synthase subunit alpha [Planctomycetaceae bacterium]
MSAIDQRFQELKADHRKAFIPFVTAGDPSLDATAAALQTLSDAGAAVIEVGIPYSDPIADGPVIQASYTRALDSGTSLQAIFEAIAQIAPKLDCPLACMVSYSIILRIGLEKFVQSARAAGFAGAIVPDLLVEEAGKLREICQDQDFSLIHLVTPTTPPERMLEIAKGSSGFVYFVSVTGITGERNQLPPDLADKVSWLRDQTDVPVCIGFGISTPEHARHLAPVADGLIVGSAIVRRLADGEIQDSDARLEEVAHLATEIIAAMH